MLGMLLLSVLIVAPIDVQVTLTDGTTVMGTVDLRSFKITTGFGSAQVDAEHLAQIVFGDDDVLVTDDGFELRGKVELRSLRVKTDAGNKVFRRDHGRPSLRWPATSEPLSSLLALPSGRAGASLPTCRRLRACPARHP